MWVAGIKASIGATMRICEQCDFWLKESVGQNGECRALPPEFAATINFGVWPFTKPSDWCGKWKKIMPIRAVNESDNED